VVVGIVEVIVKKKIPSIEGGVAVVAIVAVCDVMVYL
jgi:hypothetical protein